MTIATTTSKASYAGNGTTTAFSIAFPFAKNADIHALLLEDDVETALSLGSHYTLAGAGGSGGGTLTMLTAPASGQTLVIWRAPDIVQEVDYVENSAFPAETHEGALDLLTMICQSLQEQLGRAVIYPVSTPAEDILDSTDFLDATAANATASQAAQTAAEAAQGLAETARSQAQGYAASASGSAASAAASADAAAEIVSTGLPTASTSIKGVVQLATSAEVSTGTDAAKAVTPAALKPALDAKLNASGALAAIGAAASGANSDITSLSGLTTPLSVAQGGTGVTTGLSDSSALAVMYALLYCRSQSRASGPIPYGYIFPLLTDELATKTNAAFDATGKFYTNDSDVHGYAIDGASDVSLYSGNNTALGQSFVPATTAVLWGSKFKIAKVGSPTGSVYAKLYAATGTHGTDAKPTGAALATSAALDISTLTTTTALKRFVFTTPYTPSAGTTYIAVLEYSGGDASNKLIAAADGTTKTDAGNWCYYTSSTWTGNANRDVYFAVFTALDATLIPVALTTGAHPSSITVRFLHQAADAVTYGTDIKVRVSTDGGSNWSEYGSIAKLCAYDADYDLLEVTFDTSGLTGTSLKVEVTTYNIKSQRVAGIALSYA